MGLKKKILVIDDEPSITLVIRRLLISQGYEVFELHDSLKLEDYLLYTDLDLIITDLKMPGRDGMEVIKIVRLSRPNVPIAVLTGHATIDNAVEATKCGAAAFLSKPIKSDELISAVNKLARADEAMAPAVKKALESGLVKQTKPAKPQGETILLNSEIISTDTVPAGFVEINMDVIVPGEKTPIDIYLQIYVKNENKHYLQRLCPANTVFTSGLRHILYRRELSCLFIREKDYRDYLKFYGVLKNLPSFRMENIKDEKKMLLYGKAMEAINEIISEPVGANNIRAGVTLLDDIIKTMVKDPDVFQDMYLLFQRDTSIFNHSANVTLLATSFALYLGTDPKVVKFLGLGALFHDIGLNKVDKNILDKTGPLSPSEWAEIKAHPERGASVLKSSMIYPQSSLRIVLEHHENNEGTGYPRGLTGNQISNLARLVRIADKFDSLTTAKPYRSAFTPALALKQIFIEETLEPYRRLVKQFITFLAGKKRS